MPRYPKHPSARQGHSSGPTKELVVREPDEIEIPPLPVRYKKRLSKSGEIIEERHEAEWHPEAVRAWNEIWSSPMAPEFQVGHEAGLRILLQSITIYWEKAEEGYSSAELYQQIVITLKQYALTPMSLRSMGYIVADTANVVSQTEARQRKTGRKKPRAVEAQVEDADVVDLASDYKALEA